MLHIILKFFKDSFIFPNHNPLESEVCSRPAKKFEVSHYLYSWNICHYIDNWKITNLKKKSTKDLIGSEKSWFLKVRHFGQKRYKIFECPTFRSILGGYMEENVRKNITTFPKILPINKISQKKSRIGIKAKCKWIKIETYAVYLF